MNTMQVHYVGDLRTEATHLKSGVEIMTDAPPDNNGKGESFSPTDLLCSSLVSCQMTLMGIAAKREGIDADLHTMKAAITKVMASDPRRVSEIKIYYTTPESMKQLSEKHKIILKRAALTCPVAMSLHPDIKQEIVFDF